MYAHGCSTIVAKKLLAGWSGGFGPAGVGRDWQLHGLRDVLMWVLPSTSGRAVMTWEQRISPFRELKAYLTENTAEWV
ncbi:hypothetical protein SARC_15610 [Sphaeroforma arctica JP610]|uniref:Uncharacterized protein n=1 Tax=Sphaeroforma arctica JP610 TaxID=667725 RepID=A0A0L0F5I7_9EUKA|nr:hypothetical protein SARC_15610 [Sphaeroforma arctica JP610]KNC71846.1 hypothetical protein SARC_15610 [Sphaeroforma arctica JP610]|eukprot:XP_014145748.1 hypothetical protein SARC_15610 [Sphaeroforma arctica JP610]